MPRSRRPHFLTEPIVSVERRAGEWRARVAVEFDEWVVGTGASVAAAMQDAARRLARVENWPIDVPAGAARAAAAAFAGREGG